MATDLDLAGCLPSWSTRRTSRPTYGGVVAQIAKEAFGKDLMPWQRYVADIALEYDPKTLQLAYRDVRLTVPRQSGKSTLLLPVVVLRAEASERLGGRQTMLYAAQTGVDSRRMWRDEYVVELERSKMMRGHFRVAMPAGSESVIFRDGSKFSPIAMTHSAGHGRVLDAGFLDEAFAYKDDRVDQAWDPAMITRPQAQKWIVSTVGSVESLYFREKVEQGRAAAEGGLTEDVCYFEWSADPDADPSDPRTWTGCMPALGFTQTVKAIQGRFAGMALNEFRRAFLNQWTDTLHDTIIPAASWNACKDEGSRRVGKVVAGLDMARDRSSAAVAIAGTRSDGLPHIQVVAYGPGTDWVLGQLVDMHRRREILGVAIDKGGPAGSFMVDLANAGVPMIEMGAAQLAQACGAFYDACVTEQLRHIGQSMLDQAIAGAGKRELLDAWAWSRKKSTCDTSPLVATTVALWGLSATPPDYDVMASIF